MVKGWRLGVSMIRFFVRRSKREGRGFSSVTVALILHWHLHRLFTSALPEPEKRRKGYRTAGWQQVVAYVRTVRLLSAR
jgi:hypothetical protein